jgi:hypothetical protein
VAIGGGLRITANRRHATAAGVIGMHTHLLTTISRVHIEAKGYWTAACHLLSANERLESLSWNVLAAAAKAWSYAACASVKLSRQRSAAGFAKRSVSHDACLWTRSFSRGGVLCRLSSLGDRDCRDRKLRKLLDFFMLATSGSSRKKLE